jgi:hypothetical protein
MVVPKLAKHYASLGTISASGVTNAMLAPTAVTTDKIVDGTVAAADMNVFVSGEQTGTGSAQNVAHGLTGTPSIVLAITTTNGAAGAFVVTYGTHTATNCVLTVTVNAKFKVLAFI